MSKISKVLTKVLLSVLLVLSVVQPMLGLSGVKAEEHEKKVYTFEKVVDRMIDLSDEVYQQVEQRYERAQNAKTTAIIIVVAFLVAGVAVSLAPFDVPCENFLLNTGLNMSLVFEIPVMLGVMSLMIFPALATKKLGRWQGILLLCIYAAFCVCQFVL